MKCKKCNKETKLLSLGLCDQCDAFRIFEINPPTIEVLKRVKKTICEPCSTGWNYPIEIKTNCGYCIKVKKYYQKYQNLKKL